jgi:hypothetical protein
MHIPSLRTPRRALTTQVVREVQEEALEADLGPPVGVGSGTVVDGCIYVIRRLGPLQQQHDDRRRDHRDPVGTAVKPPS